MNSAEGSINLTPSFTKWSPSSLLRDELAEEFEESDETTGRSGEVVTLEREAGRGAGEASICLCLRLSLRG